MKMKKFLAVVLSFALSFSLAMPTFAQDNTASAAQAVQSEVTETSNDENVSADENTSKDASAETVKEDSKTEAYSVRNICEKIEILLNIYVSR